MAAREAVSFVFEIAVRRGHACPLVENLSRYCESTVPILDCTEFNVFDKVLRDELIEDTELLKVFVLLSRFYISESSM